MTRPSSFRYPGQSSAQSATKAMQSTKGVADFLRAHDKMASLLPAATRMAELQRDCATLLPAVFDACAVLQFEAGQLILSVPNTALAAKLKQQLPKLQDGLLKRGWQVNAIRLKVQIGKIAEKLIEKKKPALPAKAVSALATLGQTLEDSPRNQALKAAISAMVKRHRDR